MPPKRKFRNVRRKKRKFTGNKYTKKRNSEEMEGTDDQESVKESEESDITDIEDEKIPKNITRNSDRTKSMPATLRKLDDKSSDSGDPENDEEEKMASIEGFRLIDISVLASVFESFWCPMCKYGHVTFEEDCSAKMGFATLFVLKCTSKKCKYSKRFFSSAKIEGSQAYEVNRRVVLATRNIGIGHQSLVKFAAVMNMLPPMNENSYRDHVATIRNSAETVAKESMQNAAEEAKEFYEPGEDGVFDIGVSGDGTWRRRGYSSAYGVVTAISTVTGKVLDVEVMSKECKECMVWRSKEGTVEFQEWWEGHQHLCQANYFGSSGSMDASGMLAIFERSVQNYSVRYTEFLGDGDSKSHKLIVEEAVYGPVEVRKLECVGHVQKRLGSRLRSLKKRTGQTRLQDGKPIGGRGRLTDNVIDKLQVYYGKAIRNNTHDIQAMENAVMAIWHHTQSTADSPDHDLCPPGESSWCGFQRDVAQGTSDYRHNHPLPMAVANAIYPTFEALSEQSLLACCLHGGTQNQNEAINALIWQRATKETHSGLAVVELATFLAVSHFNNGTISIILVLRNLGIDPGFHCIKACRKQDNNRIRHSRRNSSERAKKRRKQIRNFKKGYSDTLEAIEGQQYGAGAF